MIYVDTPFLVENNHPTAPKVFRGKASAHLTADTEAELIQYAVRLGMKRHWIQYPGTWRFHFDVTGVFLLMALNDARKGVIKQLTAREMVTLFRSRMSGTSSSVQQ